MNFAKEFKEFATKGNVVDMAVGVIIGGAFGKIVSSFVTDIVMPPIGLALGKVDFSTLYINLGATAYPTLAEAKKAGAPTLNYGLFINNIIDFLIVALVIFMAIKFLNRLKKPVAVTATTKECPQCLSVIALGAKRCPQCTSQI